MMRFATRLTLLFALSGILSGLNAVRVLGDGAPWPRHTIDGSSRGADGVRLLDVNGDGRLDMATGWEEGGVIRAYLHPGSERVRENWPAVTVGEVKSAEDAVFVDLDGDGATDVVSCCEGRTRSIYFHWAPRSRENFLDAAAWQTEVVPCAANQQLWMFAVPLDIDGRNGIDLIVGSKGDNGSIGWLESPEDPRRVRDWKYHRLRDAGWIMSLMTEDVDGDGDLDVLASDRKGAARGIFWLINPGTEAVRRDVRWLELSVGATNREVMFLDQFQMAENGRRLQILAAARPSEILWYRRQPERASVGIEFELRESIELPGAGIGTAKSVRAADLDLDEKLDLVFSCEQADGRKEGVVWLRGNGEVGLSVSDWQQRSISGETGVKFDLLQLVDLDADGDLDVITCEERANLGVIWYENPAR